MKTLYIIARNHMDPSWERCFTDHFDDPDSGTVKRPYSDLEELQILEYMDFAEKYGVRYHIEQSLVVKKFLERNPDQTDRFTRLVREGYLELAGGGETVIDCNLTRGESWARNHLYSRKYYKEKFGHSPRYAITPDIFGLPSQLPQFFRSLGYDALIVFDRVLKDNKPFWRGLDGTLIVLDSKWLQPPQPYLRTADCVKSFPCPVCGGKGCAACHGSGLDPTYNMTRTDKTPLKGNYFGNMTADEMLDELLKSDAEEYFVMIVTEEPLIGDRFFGRLNEIAPKRGVTVRYLTFEENHDVWCPGQVARLRSGDYTDDEIDLRPEGNPASTGDCSSRIEIKKANAELEQLLFEAETLAVIARMAGGFSGRGKPSRPYPAAKTEALWNKMAFIQFHDCVTGTHCDASYNELLRYIREVRRGGEQIMRDAALELTRDRGLRIPDGMKAFMHFNPTQCEADYPLLTMELPDGTLGAEIYNERFERLDSFDLEVTKAMVGVIVRCRVRCAIPAMGAAVFYVKALTEPENKTARKVNAAAIENEYFIVSTENGEINGVFGKEENALLLKGAGLVLSEDIGGPWCRQVPEKDGVPLKADEVTLEKGEGCERIILSGVYSAPAAGVKRLGWELTATLFAGEKAVRWHTRLDWDGVNTRILAAFTPAFGFEDDLYCEVPFGTMKRPPIEEGTACLGLCDEWPSLGFAGVEGSGLNFAVIKGGFPGTSLRKGQLRLSLMRATAFNSPEFAGSYRGASDKGIHTADFASVFGSGSFPAAKYSRAAQAFCSHGHTIEIGCGENDVICGRLLPEICSLPDNVRLSALKWAEDGSGPVIRVWECEGKPAHVDLGGFTARRCDTLERETDGRPAAVIDLRPYEIATLKLIL